jgi:uncharacterized integral membrane protein
MHLIWLSLVLPAMFLMPWASKKMRLPKLWLAVFASALIGILIYVGIDLAQFFSNQGQANQGTMRVLFAVMSMTELPLIAIAIGSTINWSYSKKQRRKVTLVANESGSQVTNSPCPE